MEQVAASCQFRLRNAEAFPENESGWRIIIALMDQAGELINCDVLGRHRRRYFSTERRPFTAVTPTIRFSHAVKYRVFLFLWCFPVQNASFSIEKGLLTEAIKGFRLNGTTKHLFIIQSNDVYPWYCFSLGLRSLRTPYSFILFYYKSGELHSRSLSPGKDTQ